MSVLAPTKDTQKKKTIFEYLEDPRATAALPSLKAVLDELSLLTEQHNIRLDEVTRLVRADQGMSLRVLRVANSSYYAPTEPLMDVQSAVLYIGLGTFRESVISARCIEKTCHIEQNILDWKDFWTHAAGVGLITMQLATHLEKVELQDESFYLMGLLHDIGKVVLAQLMPSEFDRIYEICQKKKTAPCEMEMSELGIDHSNLGAWYLQKQGIPPAIVEPIRFHHAWRPENRRHLNHAGLINLADQIALKNKLGQSGNHTDHGDPFASPEWKWYLSLCARNEDEGAELKRLIMEQVTRINELAPKMIS